MNNDIDRIFAQQVLALMEKRKFDVITYREFGRDGDNFKAEIRIPKTEVAITIERKKHTSSHSEVEPDPRMFGDTAAVTASAMRDWYPGKTNNWSETKTTVVIEASGLPEIGYHKENYKYTEWSYFDDTKKAVKEIIRLVQDRNREMGFEKDRQNKTTEAQKIKNAFARI